MANDDCVLTKRGWHLLLLYEEILFQAAIFLIVTCNSIDCYRCLEMSLSCKWYESASFPSKIHCCLKHCWTTILDKLRNPLTWLLKAVSCVSLNFLGLSNNVTVYSSLRYISVTIFSVATQPLIEFLFLSKEVKNYTYFLIYNTQWLCIFWKTNKIIIELPP